MNSNLNVSGQQSRFFQVCFVPAVVAKSFKYLDFLYSEAHPDEDKWLNPFSWSRNYKNLFWKLIFFGIYKRCDWTVDSYKLFSEAQEECPGNQQGALRQEGMT